jgi:hypothetical protein
MCRAVKGHPDRSPATRRLPLKMGTRVGLHWMRRSGNGSGKTIPDVRRRCRGVPGCPAGWAAGHPEGYLAVAVASFDAGPSPTLLTAVTV